MGPRANQRIGNPFEALWSGASARKGLGEAESCCDAGFRRVGESAETLSLSFGFDICEVLSDLFGSCLGYPFLWYPTVVIQEKVGKMASSKPKKRGWGPLQPERRNKRVPLNGVNMLERARAVKRKNNLEIEKGKQISKQISTSSLLEIASSIDLEVPAEELSKQKVVN